MVDPACPGWWHIHLDALADRAAAAGGTALYVCSAPAHGLPLSAGCLASVLPDSVPDGPADLVATVLADGPDDEAVTLVVDGTECAGVRRFSAGTARDPLAPDGTLLSAPDDDPSATAEALEEAAGALPSTGLDVYIPFPDNTPRTLLLSFSKSAPESIREAMTALFEAMAESLRWTRGN